MTHASGAVALHSAAVLPGTGPGRRSPGSVSSRRPTAAAAGSGHWQILGSAHVQPHGHASCIALHCSSRLVGAAHLARRGGAAAATAQLTGAGQLPHPRCGSPPRSPDRRIVDSRTQVHAHARHASSRSSCPKNAGRRPPPRTVPRRLPDAADPDLGTKSCVAARRAPRQGRLCLVACRAMPALHARPLQRCPPPASSSGMGTTLPAAPERGC
jgi:hypothetical protein